MINRLDTANRISGQDTQILREVKRFRNETARHGQILRRAHLEQERIVAQRAAAKARIEQGIANRQQLLASIKDQIAQLKVQEARHQAELRRQAQARMAALRAQQQARLAQVVVGATAQAPSATPNASNAVTTVAPPSRYGSGVVGVAMAQLGKPYVWAAAGPDSFDCSGLIVYAFAQFGVSLPHFTNSLFAMGVYVSRDQLQPGDLVFFDGLGHMGIYIGGGQFIHAPHTGDVVKITSMNDPWAASTYVGARRILYRRADTGYSSRQSLRFIKRVVLSGTFRLPVVEETLLLKPRALVGAPVPTELAGGLISSSASHAPLWTDRNPYSCPVALAAVVGHSSGRGRGAT